MNKKFSILKLTLCLFIGVAILAAPLSSAVAEDIKLNTMTRMINDNIN